MAIFPPSDRLVNPATYGCSRSLPRLALRTLRYRASLIKNRVFIGHLRGFRSLGNFDCNPGSDFLPNICFLFQMYQRLVCLFVNYIADCVRDNVVCEVRNRVIEQDGTAEVVGPTVTKSDEPER